ncbi:MAG: hypothetical protein ACMXX8_03440, partial [Candidatus Woesearchaeota archaeon]
MKKIIFLIDREPFYQKYYNDLFIKDISREFKIEMFSILKTDLKQYYLIKKLKLPNNLKEVVNFKNFNELEKKLNKKDIIITTYFNYNNKNLNKLIKKYDLTVI